MPQHVAIRPGTLYPQPDYTISVDREGKWTVAQAYLCHRASVVRLMPRPGTPHPEVPFATLDAVSARVTGGDLAEITCTYAGTDPSQNEGEEKNPASYSMGLSLSDALVALLAARAAILLPLPAAVGALEASQALAMVSLGLPAAYGISLSLLIRGRDVLLGLLGLGLAAGYVQGSERVRG